MRQKLSRVEVAEILARYTQGLGTPEDNEKILRWFDELGSDVHLYTRADVREVVRQRILTGITKHTQAYSLADSPNPSIYSSFFHRYRKLAAVAALITAVTISGVMWVQRNHVPAGNPFADAAVLTEVFNDGLSVREVVLSDGSMVKLQPRSTLKFNDVKHATSRVVTLEGEAYFEVAHDKQRPFFVHAGRTVTKVLGTSFTIEAPGELKTVSVTVRTGTVSVSKESSRTSQIDTKSQVIVTPNQRVVYDPVLDQLTASVVERPVLLPENVNREAMEFDDESVSVILKKLETAYGVHISFDKTILSKCRISTKFTTEGLFDRLNVVAKAIGASYQRDGTQIVFTSTGC